jgi:hypothetical protein
METYEEFAKAVQFFVKKTEAIRGTAYSFPRKRDVELSHDFGWSWGILVLGDSAAPLNTL